MADVIEQDNLIEIKGRRPHKLPEVFVRPALDGKRLPGEVEIHQNGVRYVSYGQQKIGMTVIIQRTSATQPPRRCTFQQCQALIFPTVRA